MVVIRFSDEDTEEAALGFLVGRFSFKSFANGDTIVPEEALVSLASEGLRFTVEGRATYEQLIPSVRNSASKAVQRRRSRAQ